MAIVDLQAKQGNVDIVAQVVSKEEPRQFNKFGKEGKVCNATIKDETGEIKLTLWNDQIDQVKVGDKVHVVNGYVNEWQGEKQLSTGKFGRLEIVESSETSEIFSNATMDELKEEINKDDKKQNPNDEGFNVDEEEIE